jgi:hypothetical protein
MVQKLPENRPKEDKDKIKKDNISKRKENLSNFTQVFNIYNI